jgi:hypothetical protein
MDVDTLVELYDTDILKIEGVVHALDRFGEDHGWRVDVEDYRIQIIDRFNDAGFDVNVQFYEKLYTGGDRRYEPFVQINRKIEAKQFDYDQQVWEATHDVLALGEEGFIKTPSGIEVPKKHDHRNC